MNAARLAWIVGGAGLVGLADRRDGAAGGVCVRLAGGTDDLVALAARVPGAAACTRPDRRTLGHRHSAAASCRGSASCRCCCRRSFRCCSSCRTSIPGCAPGESAHLDNGFYLNAPFAAARWIFYLIVWFGLARVGRRAAAPQRTADGDRRPWTDPAGPDSEFRRHRFDHVAGSALQLQRFRHDQRRRERVVRPVHHHPVRRPGGARRTVGTRRPGEAAAKPADPVGVSRLHAIVDRLAIRPAAGRQPGILPDRPACGACWQD